MTWLLILTSVSVLSQFHLINLSPNYGLHYPASLHPGNFLLDVRCFEFYFLRCRIFLYSHKYSWALLWVVVMLHENCLIFSSFAVKIYKRRLEQLSIHGLLFPITEVRALCILYPNPPQFFGFSVWFLGLDIIPTPVWSPGTVTSNYNISNSFPPALSSFFICMC